MHATTIRDAVLAVVLVGCGGALPAVPGKGGPPWIELTSEHFTVWTDADGARARELVREMEHLRQVVVGVAFPAMPAAGRTLVIAMRDDDELAAFSSTDQPRAYAMSPGPPLWQPMVVLSAFSNRDPGNIAVAHELAHLISFAVIHHQPRWFAEGMAKYFETVSLDPGAATAEVGIAPQNRGQPMQMAHLVPVSMLFGWKGITASERPEYSTSWALFTFLINEHRPELVHYMELLRSSGKPRDQVTVEEAQRMWREAFPSLPLGEVDLELKNWLLTGHHVVLRFNVPPRSWPIAERALGDADVYAVRGMLRILTSDRDADARPDLAAALAAEPTNVLARVFTVALDRKMLSVDEARAMTAAHGADWRAWWLAAMAISAVQGSAEELEAARAKACTILAHNPAVIAPPKLCDDEVSTGAPR